MLTERRKADREKMADAIADLATEMGVTCEREDLGPREIFLHLSSPSGLRVTVDLDGESWQPDVHVVSWNITLDSDARLADRLEP